MKLEKYLLKLLAENETVIIPGFGAFVARYQHAEISESEIKPPSREITFTTQIRNNDGLMVDYVAKTENVSHFDALKIIERERDKMIFQLDKGEDIALKDIGLLTVASDGELHFEPSTTSAILSETMGLETILLQKSGGHSEETEMDEAVKSPVVENESENVIEEAMGESETAVSHADEVGVVDQTKIPVEETVPIASDTEQPAEIKDKKQEGSTAPVIDGELTEESKEEVLSVVEPDDIEKEEERRKRGGWIWIVLFVLALLVAGFFIARHFWKNKSTEENTDRMMMEQTSEPDEPVAAEPVAVTDTSSLVQGAVAVTDTSSLVQDAENKSDTLESSSVVQSQEEQLEEVSGEPVYYLVAGSFKKAQNVKKLINNLEEKGFEPDSLGKRGNFYIVSIGKYKSESEAVKMRRSVWQSHPDLSLWIMED